MGVIRMYRRNYTCDAVSTLSLELLIVTYLYKVLILLNANILETTPFLRFDKSHQKPKKINRDTYEESSSCVPVFEPESSL